VIAAPATPSTVAVAPSAAPNVLSYARAYVNAGYSVIPIARDGGKGPAFDRLPLAVDPKSPDKYKRLWYPFSSAIAEPKLVDEWFSDGICGVAIVGGAVSGGLCCLDIESRAVADELRASLDDIRPGLWAKMPRVRTPGAHSTDGGLHLYFRVADLSTIPNTNLAKRPNADGKMSTVIEVRNEGKYWLAPGCPAECHPMNKPYTWDKESPKITQPPLLDAQDVLAILGCAKAIDQATPKQVPTGTPAAHTPRTGTTPIDDYDARGPAWGDSQLLGGLGWREISTGLWRSPDKTNPAGHSAKVNHAKSGCEILHVFSPNAAPFAEGADYGKGRAYCTIHHKGNLSEGSKALAKLGYGDKSAKVNFGSTGVGSGGQAAGGAGSGPVGSPSPDQTAEQPEPWSTPIPLDTLAAPIPLFPLHVYPQWLRQACQGIAAAIPCPIDYPASFALAIASGMIGATTALRIKGDWTEVPSIYLCAIGKPGSGKSPALKAMMKPVAKMHRQAVHRNEKPVYVDDVTSEKLASMLNENPRGLLRVTDELTGWINSLDQYKAKGSGSDRQFYLSAWSGNPINVYRKNPDSPPLFVNHPFLSVLGGTQPDVVAAFRGNNDGFSDRILFTYPEAIRVEKEQWTVPGDDDLAAWADAVEKLHNVGQVNDGPDKPPRPWFLDLNAAGKRQWELFIEWAHAQQADDATPDYMIEPIQKLTNYVPRFAVILHILRHLPLGEDDTFEIRKLPAVGEEPMAGAMALAQYYLDHAMRAYGEMRSSPRLRLMRKIVKWLSDKKVTEFNRRELHRAFRRSVNGSDDLIEPIRELVQTAYIRYKPAVQHAGSGRVGEGSYEVNPNLKPSDVQYSDDDET